jgi:hypothetical protein
MDEDLLASWLCWRGTVWEIPVVEVVEEDGHSPIAVDMFHSHVSVEDRATKVETDLIRIDSYSHTVIIL